MSRGQFFFLILNNWQTGNGFKERNQVIDNIFLIHIKYF